MQQQKETTAKWARHVGLVVALASSTLLFVVPSLADSTAPSVIDKAACDTQAVCQTLCDSGNPSACYEAARLRLQAAKERETSGVGGSQDQEKIAAVAALESACQHGSYRACLGAAGVYQPGHGVGPIRPDAARSASLYAKSFSIISKACDANDAKACTYLAELYVEGNSDMNVPKDEAKAFAFNKKGCDGGVGEGCFNAGIMYRDGISVPKDAAQGKSYMTKACGMSYGPACTESGNAQKGCALGDEGGCDVQCRGGDRSACAHASEAVRDQIDGAWAAVAEPGDALAQKVQLVEAVTKLIAEGSPSTPRLRRDLQRMLAFNQIFISRNFCPAKKQFIQEAGAAEFQKRASDHCKNDPPTGLAHPDQGLAGGTVKLTSQCKAVYATPCP